MVAIISYSNPSFLLAEKIRGLFFNREVECILDENQSDFLKDFFIIGFIGEVNQAGKTAILDSCSFWMKNGGETDLKALVVTRFDPETVQCTASCLISPEPDEESLDMLGKFLDLHGVQAMN